MLCFADWSSRLVESLTIGHFPLSLTHSVLSLQMVWSKTMGRDCDEIAEAPGIANAPPPTCPSPRRWSDSMKESYPDCWAAAVANGAAEDETESTATETSQEWQSAGIAGWTVASVFIGIVAAVAVVYVKSTRGGARLQHSLISSSSHSHGPRARKSNMVQIRMSTLEWDDAGDCIAESKEPRPTMWARATSTSSHDSELDHRPTKRSESRENVLQVERNTLRERKSDGAAGRDGRVLGRGKPQLTE